VTTPDARPAGVAHPSVLLVADDEPAVRLVLARLLAAPGRKVLSAGSKAEALALAFAEGPVDVALLDRNLGDGTGLEVAAALKARRPETEVILVTDYASFQSALEALQVGLYDYLSKPIDDFEALRLKLDNAFEKVRLQLARRKAEEELRQMQKMDAIGRLAGGLGHDLGNMLAVILSWLEELTPGATGTVATGLGEMQGAAERATRLVRQMMTLSRKGPADPVLVSLDRAIEDMAKLLRRSLGPRVELVLELAHDLPPVFADPSHLGQVFLNLAVNARDAMPDGGRLTFRTSAVEAGRAIPGPAVVLEVSDEGVGMPPEVLARVFEPFFTTKAEGLGTGLGLAIVFGIVGQAGGAIQVESEPGRGTTFRVGLPRAAEGVAGGPVQAARAAAGPLSGTAIVVEPDAALRALMARSLRQAGLDVLDAAGGDEALAMAGAPGARVDLLVAADVMAGRTGPALAAAVRALHPACRALLASGFPGDPEVAAFAAGGGVLVQKPFGMGALVEAARSLLAAP